MSGVTTKTGAVSVPYGDPTNEEQWAEDFLVFIGAPATKANLTFITAAELFEGTFHANPDFIPRKYGDDNRYNPLDSTQFEAGGVVWAENGGDPVWQFPSLKAGLESNAAVIEENPGDQDLLKDLRRGNKSAEELVADVGASDWGTGGGPGSAAEVGYSVDLTNELQEALSEVHAALPTSSAVAEPPGFWHTLIEVPGAAPGEVKKGATDIKNAVGSQFTKDLKSAWPYALMIAGIIAGLGLFVLGAKKAATGKSSGGATVNIVQQQPATAEAAA